jgi:hypothetical protein
MRARSVHLTAYRLINELRLHFWRRSRGGTQYETDVEHAEQRSSYAIRRQLFTSPQLRSAIEQSSCTTLRNHISKVLEVLILRFQKIVGDVNEFGGFLRLHKQNHLRCL